MSPSVRHHRHESSPTQTLYMGSILKEADVAAARAVGRVSVLTAPDLKDHAKNTYFAKGMDGALKPRAGVGALSEEKKSYPGTGVALRQEHAVQQGEVSFSIGNYSDILTDIAFHDIRGLLKREDIGGVMEFQAAVSLDGRIGSLEKTVGSGDPLLDAYVVRKLKNAVFKHPPVGRLRVKIRFHLRESANVAN